MYRSLRSQSEVAGWCTDGIRATVFSHLQVCVNLLRALRSSDSDPTHASKALTKTLFKTSCCSTPLMRHFKPQAISTMFPHILSARINLALHTNAYLPHVIFPPALIGS